MGWPYEPSVLKRATIMQYPINAIYVYLPSGFPFSNYIKYLSGFFTREKKVFSNFLSYFSCSAFNAILYIKSLLKRGVSGYIDHFKITEHCGDAVRLYPVYSHLLSHGFAMSSCLCHSSLLRIFHM